MFVQVVIEWSTGGNTLALHLGLLSPIYFLFFFRLSLSLFALISTVSKRVFLESLTELQFLSAKDMLEICGAVSVGNRFGRNVEIWVNYKSCYYSPKTWSEWESNSPLRNWNALNLTSKSSRLLAYFIYNSRRTHYNNFNTTVPSINRHAHLSS